MGYPFQLCRIGLLVGLMTALAGSVWYVLGSRGCHGCSRAAALVGYWNLGLFGAVYYGSLASLAGIWLFRHAAAGHSGLSFPVLAGIVLAGSVHLALVLLLMRHRVACPPCLTMAAGALLALSAVVILYRPPLPRVLLAMSVLVVATYVGAKLLKSGVEARWLRVAQNAERALVEERLVPPEGKARMVIYTREHCPSCTAFRNQVLNPLHLEFGRGLVMDERVASAHMAVPTVIILGRRNAVFVGNHALESIRLAILQARGPATSLSVTEPEERSGKK